MVNQTQKYWQERARIYKNDIRGVLFKKPYPSFVNTLFHNWSVREVQKIIKKGDNVLDIACGWGRVTKELLSKNKNINIRGVDISKPYVEMYNKQFNPRGKGYVSSMERMPFKAKEFDKAFLIVSLMYLSKRQQQLKAINEIFRVLKPKGQFVLIERTPLMAKFDLGRILKKGGREQISFTQKQIRGLIEQAKGKVVKQSYWPAKLLPLYISYTIKLVSQ